MAINPAERCSGSQMLVQRLVDERRARCPACEQLLTLSREKLRQRQHTYNLPTHRLPVRSKRSGRPEMTIKQRVAARA